MIGNDSNPSQTGILLPFTGLVVCLAALLLTNINDLDHGFHIAQGNSILENGLPESQILVPALVNEPWTSVYALGSMAVALVWNAAGPAGLVLLKLLGYGGAFLLSAWAAVRRNAFSWFACLIAGLCAASMQIRYVERPTLFSALLLGLVVFAFASDSFVQRMKQSPLLMVPPFAAVSTIWAFTHAGWNIGLFVMTMFVLSAVKNWKPRLLMIGSIVAVPALMIVLVHPAGFRALAGPVAFVSGEGAKFRVAEHQLTAWKAMPFAPVVWLAAAVTAVVLLRTKRLYEALAIAGLLAGNLLFPRFILPLAIVSIPLVAEVASGFSALKQAPRRMMIYSTLLTILAGFCATAVTPWRSWGFSIDSTLDTRGVGDIAAQLDGDEGPVLASFGWSSLLLSNMSVAELGVVMDGRLEEYSDEYYEEIYRAAMVPGSDWPGAVETTGAALYCEPWDVKGTPRLAGRFTNELGWLLVGWDNSSRLFARPDVAADAELSVLRFDPWNLDEILSSDTSPDEVERELRLQTSLLEERGYPSARGRISVARVAAMRGDIDSAEESLRIAEQSDGQRFASWWGVKAACAVARGDWNVARTCVKQLRSLGSEELAQRIESSFPEK